MIRRTNLLPFSSVHLAFMKSRFAWRVMFTELFKSHSINLKYKVFLIEIMVLLYEY